MDHTPVVRRWLTDTLYPATREAAARAGVDTTDWRLTRTPLGLYILHHTQDLLLSIATWTTPETAYTGLEAMRTAYALLADTRTPPTPATPHPIVPPLHDPITHPDTGAPLGWIWALHEKGRREPLWLSRSIHDERHSSHLYAHTSPLQAAWFLTVRDTIAQRAEHERNTIRLREHRIPQDGETLVHIDSVYGYLHNVPALRTPTGQVRLRPGPAEVTVAYLNREHFLDATRLSALAYLDHDGSIIVVEPHRMAQYDDYAPDRCTLDEDGRYALVPEFDWCDDTRPDPLPLPPGTPRPAATITRIPLPESPADTR